MKVVEQIKILEEIRDNIKKENINARDDKLVIASRQTFVLTEIANKLRHSIGLSTQDEIEHEKSFV